MKPRFLIAAVTALWACSSSSESGTERAEASFFGNLHVEYRDTEVRAWNEKDGFDLPFKEYEVVEESVDAMNLKLREYFCRVPGDS